MKKNVKGFLKNSKIIFFVLCIILLCVMESKVFASSIVDIMNPLEYTEEFKEYLKLSEEEQEKVLQPRMFNISNTSLKITNPLRLMRLKGSLTSRYDLREVISENMIIRNQMQTNSCWAFASLASLETNLALSDYYNGLEAKVYDFSERHMEYATTRVFANNKINENGFNRKAGDGGNWYQSETYLINGYGAVNESQMPFENNQDLIDISKIQNKNVETQVYDTILFNSTTPGRITTEEMNKIKEHIKNYGAVYAATHGAQINFDSKGCYNNTTGALYCNNTITHAPNHAIAIVGWDDNYSVEKFNADSRPTKNGAWIVKNSWGEILEEYTLEEMKEIIFEQLHDELVQNGITEASQIPDQTAKEMFISIGFVIENDKAVLKYGDNGYIYISYEDVNVYSNLWGIVKATNNVEYDNIYMYNNYNWTDGVGLATSKLYLANEFNKKTTGKEYLTRSKYLCTRDIYLYSVC